MAETLVEEKVTKKSAYGITPEMREEYCRKLDRMIQEQGIKAAKTEEDLYQHSDNSGQTQEEIQAEVDEFLRMREQWLDGDRKLREDRENKSGD
jgi:hypothetical protein